MNAVRDELALRRELYGDSRIEQLRVPPHSLEAEQAVLGGLLLVPEAWAQVADVLTAGDFYRRDHARIWQAIADLAEQRKVADVVTVGEVLAGNDEVDAGYLFDLVSGTGSAANITAYAEIVRDKAGMRKLIDVGTGIVNDGFQPDGRDFAELLNGVSQRVGELQPTQRGGMRKASETLPAWFRQFEDRYQNGIRMTGLPTPWSELNDATHGLQPSTLYLLAGRPSMGKSIAGLSLAMFNALRGKTTGFFSLEMSAEECHARNVSSLANVPHDWVIAPSEDTEDGYLTRMTPAIRDLNLAPLFIDDTAGITVRQFEARARRMHMRNPLDLLVIDHIHDFKIDPKLARFEYGQIAQTAKNLAKEWKIPVVALAQLNRCVSSKSEKRPTLADLRESGELEQKADVVLFLHREDYYDTPSHKTHLQGIVEMHIAKGRNIRAGSRIYLRNRFDCMRMEDWEGALPQEPVEPKRERGFGQKFGRGPRYDD